jgi:transaldolase / glucose-6-phosphate isomerase
MTGNQIFISMGDYRAKIEKAFWDLEDNKIMTRIWDHDYTVWKPDPKEISNRLGWLHSPHAMLEEVARLEDLASDLQAEGFTRAVLLGMGGSSLAPEVLRETFGVQAGYLDLFVLDSTDPDAIRALESKLTVPETVFIVATKSGGTVETLSFFKFFYNLVLDSAGLQDAGKQFIAITDPGSKLEQLARQYQFRSTFLNDPNIGGRYSALSFFGLVPAALLGIDLETLLASSLTGLCSCESCDCAMDENNYGVQLGAVLGILAQEGRDKLTLVTSREISSFGNWVEQLIAESTGKEGTGILPVVGENITTPDQYLNDRVFVYLKLEDDLSQDAAINKLIEAGYPVIWIQLADHYDLGGQFFLWELATAIAGHILKINPFDQPNVESSKILARKMVAEYQETGKLPGGEFSNPDPAVLDRFLDESILPGSYLSLQAYLQPTPEIEQALQTLRQKLRDKYKIATTLGFGPRFLHSTGQLHKGDGGKGVFIQFISHSEHDLPIPDQAGKPASRIGFGILKSAQAEGDARALQEGNRKIIRFDLGLDPLEKLRDFLS